MKRYLRLAILTSFALIISLFEQSMNGLAVIPGAKPGLSNIIILTTIALFGRKDGLFVAVVKSLLLVLITGSVTSLFYSLAGGVVSVVVMGTALEYAKKYLSFIGISVLGSVSHNLTQILVASYVLGTDKIFAYFPLLTVVGTATGIFVGICSKFLTDHLKKIMKAGSM